MSSGTLNIDDMRNVDIRTVNRNALIDLKSVPVNTRLPRCERVADYIKRIRNPFCYKCGGIVIKESFANNGLSIEDCLEQYIGTLV